MTVSLAPRPSPCSFNFQNLTFTRLGLEDEVHLLLSWREGENKEALKWKMFQCPTVEAEFIKAALQGLARWDWAGLRAANLL